MFYIFGVTILTNLSYPTQNLKSAASGNPTKWANDHWFDDEAEEACNLELQQLEN